MTQSFHMNPRRLVFHSAIAGLLIAVPGALSAKADADSSATANTPPAETAESGDTPSIIERKLVDVAQDSEKLFSEMGTGNLNQEDFERKILDLSYRYDELIARNPHNINTLILYGKFLRRIGKNDQANVMFVHADQLSPDIAVVKQQLGNYLAEEGNYDEALKYYRKAIDLAPKEAVYHYGMGELLATFRDKFAADGTFSSKDADAQSLAEFKKAAELDPENKDFSFRYGQAFFDVSESDWNVALSFWEKMAERKTLTHTERDAVRLYRARVCCELGRGKEARELLTADVVPILGATRAGLLKRLAMENTVKEDKANAAIMAPSKQEAAKDSSTGK